MTCIICGKDCGLMDVDEEPPYKHSAMMKRTRAAIAKAKGEAL